MYNKDIKVEPRNAIHVIRAEKIVPAKEFKNDSETGVLSIASSYTSNVHVGKKSRRGLCLHRHAVSNIRCEFRNNNH